MDRNEELQLLPGTKKRLGIKVPGENRFLYIGSAILGATIVISLWLNFNNNSLEKQIKSMDEQLFTLEQQRDKKAEANIRTTRQQIALATQLIDNHTYLTKSFSELESITREDIQVKDLAIDLGANKVSLTAKAGNYTAVARQLAAFLSDDNIMDAALGEMKPSSDGVIEFSVVLMYDSTKFLKKTKAQ